MREIKIDLLGPLRPLPEWARVVVVAALVAACVVEEISGRQAEVQKGFLYSLIMFLAVLVLNELLRPKPKFEDARPGGNGDFSFPTVTEARVLSLLFGKCRYDGPNVPWYGDIDQEPIKEKVKTGWWSEEEFIKGYKYTIGVQFSLCEGEGDVELHKVVVNDADVGITPQTADGFFDIDKPELFGGDDQGEGGIQATCDFYTGSTGQAVNAYLDVAGRQRVTPTTPGHTATAQAYVFESHLVVRQMTSSAPTSGDTGAYFGNSTQVKPWRFELARFPATFAGQAAGENKVGADDCNIINVIYEVLTKSRWGLVIDPNDVDVGPGSTFVTASDQIIAEGFKFAMILDTPREAIDFLRDLERHMDGLVFLDPATGKWVVKLARDDYVVANLPPVDETNSRFLTFTRGSIRDTSNQVQVKYFRRTSDYQESYAFAQEIANVIMQGDGTLSGGKVITAVASYGGIKTAAEASKAASRLLRTLSYPLARATLELNREFWDLTPVDVVRWTNSTLGFTDLVMRVISIDFGTLQNNVITVSLVQDIFAVGASLYGTPPDTSWTNPVLTPVAFPSAEQMAVEMPRAMVVREPAYGGDDTITKIWCGARRTTGASKWEVRYRTPSGAGDYLPSGESFAFLLIGELDVGIATGTAVPTTSITVEVDPDSQSAILAVFDEKTLTEMGVDLVSLVRIGSGATEEFVLVENASVNAAKVDLDNVYRGILDTVQREHAAAAPVFLVFVGGRSAKATIGNTASVDVKLVPSTRDSELAEGSATTITFTADKRTIRPYPPSAPLYNGGSTPYDTPDVEGDGGPGENDFDVDVSYRRRRYNTADELAELLADFAPDASTEFQLRVFADPDGGNTEIASSPFAWQTGTAAISVSRLEIIDAGGDDTKQVRFQIQSRHDIGSETDLTSRNTMVHDVIPTTVNSGLTFLGANIGTGPSSAFTVVDVGVHTIFIGATASGGSAEYRINGGSWVAIVGTSGATGSLSATDTIEVRYSTGGVTPDPNFVYIENTATARVAYGAL